MNLFDNVPFNAAQEFYSGGNLPHGNTKTMNDVNISSSIAVSYVEFSKITSNPPYLLVSDSKMWKGINNK